MCYGGICGFLEEKGLHRLTEEIMHFLRVQAEGGRVIEHLTAVNALILVCIASLANERIDQCTAKSTMSSHQSLSRRRRRTYIVTPVYGDVSLAVGRLIDSLALLLMIRITELAMPPWAFTKRRRGHLRVSSDDSTFIVTPVTCISEPASRQYECLKMLRQEVRWDHVR